MKNTSETVKGESVAVHTPTPWELDSYVDDDGRETLAITSDNRPGYIVGVQCAEGVTIDDTDKANAAFIVHAVNCHDCLLEACKLLLEDLKSGDPHWKGYDSVCVAEAAIDLATQKAGAQ